MVRRWSCVNNINVKLTFFSSTYFLKKRYKFINFKASVSLKRFNKKYTKFKRKAFNRLKHLTNWSFYHNVFNEWSKNYYFFKKINKNQFLNDMFRYSFMFYNFIFLRNDATLANPWTFSFFSQIKKQNNHAFSVSKRSSFTNIGLDHKKIINKNFTHALLQTEENSVVDNATNYFLIKDSDNVFFQNDENKDLLTKKYQHLIFEKITILELKILIECAKILSQVTLLNV